MRPKKHIKYPKESVWPEIWSPGGLELAEALADAMKLPAGTFVVDGGAGSGEISCFLATEYQWHMIASEYDMEAASAIQQKVNSRGLADRVVAVKGDLTGLELANDCVGGLFCQGAFEMLADQRPNALQEMKRVVRSGGIIGIAEPMLTRELSDDEALWLYGADDQEGFRKCFRTLDWNLSLAETAELEVVEAHLYPDSKRLWNEYYQPLFDSLGNLTRPERKSEVEIWRKDRGQYHALGLLVLRVK